MGRKGLLLTAGMIILVVLAVGCGQTEKSSEELIIHEEAAVMPIKVMASISPIADIVKQIGGDLVQVEALLPPGASEHTYELTAQQIKDFIQSDLYVKIGQGLEFFDGKLLAAQGGPRNQITFADLVDLLAVDIVTLATLKEDEDSKEYEREQEQDYGHDHSHDDYDPHVWLDPILVRDVLVPAVFESLGQLRPGEIEYFTENKIRFQQELTELDQLITLETSSFSQQTFLIFHSAWRYFSRRYGLVDINVEEFPSQEVSLKRVAEIIEIARLTGAKAIFAEPQFSPQAAQIIAEGFGGEVLFLDPLGGPKISGRDSYVKLMEYNLEILKKALK